jgi:signal-transduction protein with cAMP-binding, CBS, and nucleotidyltransferase domain
LVIDATAWRNWIIRHILPIDLYFTDNAKRLPEGTETVAKHDINQVLVLQQGQLVGLLSRADIISHLQISQELGLKAQMGRKAK